VAGRFRLRRMSGMQPAVPAGAAIVSGEASSRRSRACRAVVGEGGSVEAVPQNAVTGAAGEKGRSAPTKQQIFRSALELFASQGYDATSARQLAARVGIEAGSLYNHISSKQDLLFQLIQKATYDLMITVSGQVDAAGEDPVERLAAAVRAHVVFCCVHSTQALVGDRELRALIPENFAETRKRRDEYEALFIGILEEGMRRELFRPLDSHTICFGILGLSNVALWYSPTGRLTDAEIADSYADFVLRAVLAPAALRKWVRRRLRQSG
jgi:AcrR family transcriptional regulator